MLWLKIIFMLKFFDLQLLGDEMSCDTSHFKRGKYYALQCCAAVRAT